MVPHPFVDPPAPLQQSPPCPPHGVHGLHARRRDHSMGVIGVVQVCHSMGVMHLDFKPENFLFIDLNEEAALRTIDFGLSIFFWPVTLYAFIYVTNMLLRRTHYDKPFNVAPEFLKKKYGPETDVWNAAVNEQGIFEDILHGKLDFQSELWHSISESAKDLVTRMLVRKPKRRLTAHEILPVLLKITYIWELIHGMMEGSSEPHSRKVSFVRNG
ncbi:calcium-dependent protein kinase 10-like [Phragmites australis]|uniref:calcium-dependent protein kinase 10-like n=1 Tax=Phragmites australis TaxID=29695 RepID=UPI002D76C2CA|nr:calcium-dependent protein kinase 10-like [Phragmites australis]